MSEPELHKIENVNETGCRMRVPGGWIYSMKALEPEYPGGEVFVPDSDERVYILGQTESEYEAMKTGSRRI